VGESDSVVDSAAYLIGFGGPNAIVIEERADSRNSDAVTEHFSLLTSDGKLVARPPPLYGPVFISRPNRELLSCEGNGVGQGKAALIFDLTGRVEAKVVHPGYLRTCGVSEDGRIYWLHYNAIDGGTPYNLVLIVGRGGTVLKRQRLDKAGSVVISVGASTYRFQIPAPEFPG
jgi:hypothetical protein